MSSRRRVNNEEMMTTVSLRLPARVLHMLKKQKAKDGSSVSAIVTDILEENLANSRTRAA